MNAEEGVNESLLLGGFKQLEFNDTVYTTGLNTYNLKICKQSKEICFLSHFRLIYAGFLEKMLIGNLIK